MGRIRTIKPEFPQSESVGRLSRDARLLFIQLWTLVDDEGRSRAATRMLAGQLYPYDDDAPLLIDGWLAELEREGCALRYTCDGSNYIEIQNWAKHQKVDHKSASRLPAPPQHLASPREDARALAPDLDLDLGREKDHSARADGSDESAKGQTEDRAQGKSREDRLTPAFERFLVTYPRPKERDDAFKAFRQAIAKGADPESIVRAAEIFRSEHASKGTEPRFIPYPAAWLRAGGHKDAPEVDEPKVKANGNVTPSGVFVKIDTPQWREWDRHYRENKGRGPPTNRDGGWYFPSEFPPTPNGAAH